MNEDLYWVIERQHIDSRWEAVASRVQCALIEISEDHPLVKISARNDAVFAALTRFDEGRVQIATKATHNRLPSDVSSYTDALMTQNIEIGALAHPGVALLADIRAAASAPSAHPDFKEWASLLEKAIESPAPASLNEILAHIATPESNHARMNRIARNKSLRLITGDSLRMVISYEEF